jgi:gamma-butyrobetaine dioxygenase
MNAVAKPAEPTGPSMADLARPQTARIIQRLEFDSRGVMLDWDDGRQQRLSARWLRDNCACPQCRHPQALERMYKFIEHPKPGILSATLRADGGLDVSFETGNAPHETAYARGWLRTHADTEAGMLAGRRAQHLWGADMRSRLPVLDYQRFRQTDEGLRFWIESLRTYGIVLLRGVPTDPGRLREVANRIGPIRVTNFGDIYDVKSLPNPNASADTAMGLELHTDLANWAAPPDIQFLCCLKSTASGGESVFADGYKVAADLRASDPDGYGLLCKQPFEFRFHDESCDIRARAPAISLGLDGEPRTIRFNNWLRAPMIVAEQLVEPMYDALEKMWRNLRDPANHLNLRLEPGDVVAYDNHRVLHGRTAFDPRTGERHLQGCYVNREDLESKLRLLNRQQN